jgi:hypothetical protein
MKSSPNKGTIDMNHELIDPKGKYGTMPITADQMDHEKKNLFAVALENPSLSYKAKGILAYLVSRSNEGHFSMCDLLNRSSDRDLSVRSGLNELISEGYVIRKTERSAEGKFIQVTMEICWTMKDPVE